MIKRIKIHNIQSHKNSELELNPGINAIVGSSNNGKSAILRALYWVIYNRPLGIDNLISHWAVDKKGNQIEPMSVEIENENGMVIRRRTRNENQYIVNNNELNVVKTDVPEQVGKLLCFSDTNIQKQQDSPFLLSLTNGQIAQYFNKMVRLDIIDMVLSNAESKRRQMNQKINQNEELLKEYTFKREKYEWLDDVEKLMVKYENISKKNSLLQEEFDLLNSQVERYNKLNEVKQKYNFVSEARKYIDEIGKLNVLCFKLDESIRYIMISMRNLKECKTYPSFDVQKKIIQKIYDSDTREIESEIGYLQEKISDYNKTESGMEKCRLQALDLRKQLPEICPLCGAVMKKGEYHGKE